MPVERIRPITFQSSSIGENTDSQNQAKVKLTDSISKMGRTEIPVDDKISIALKIFRIQSGATQDEVKSSFYELTKKYHADTSTDVNAELKHKAINLAYNILKKNGTELKEPKYTMSVYSKPKVEATGQKPLANKAVTPRPQVVFNQLQSSIPINRASQPIANTAPTSNIQEISTPKKEAIGAVEKFFTRFGIRKIKL